MSAPATCDFIPGTYGRRKCTTCGMTANVDPDLHAERYAHAPTVQSGDGLLWTWDAALQTFVQSGDLGQPTYADATT